MPAIFLYQDNNGTDGSNAAICSLVYELNNKQYRIPADTSEPNRIPAVEALAGANEVSTDAMIADFAAVSSPVMDKITELQGDIRTAWENNTWDIADIFPGMRTRLQSNAALYTRYLNFLRQGFGISQATFETLPLPTTAQQRNSYIAAIIFINTGGYHSLFKVLFD